MVPARLSWGGASVGTRGTGREMAAPADVSVEVVLLLPEPTTTSVALSVAVRSSTTNVDEPAPISTDEPRLRVLLSIIYWDPGGAREVVPPRVGLTVEVEVAVLALSMAMDTLLLLVSDAVVMLSAGF